MMPILQGEGLSSVRIPVASARIAPANQTHSWNRGNLPFGVACIMDGLKEIRQGAALPAVDAACPGSLEISGHCLAAARVIASLLVGPEKKRAQDKRVMYKTGRVNKKGGGRRKLWKSTQYFHIFGGGGITVAFNAHYALLNAALGLGFNNKSPSYDGE